MPDDIPSQRSRTCASRSRRLESVKNIGITLRREVSPTYAQDIEQYLTFHRDLVKSLAGRYSATLMAQGEPEEKKIVMGTPEQREEAIAHLRGENWWGTHYMDDEMERLHRERLFYSDVVFRLRRSRPARKDLVLGYRLHGNLMALSNGVPSIYSPMIAARRSSPKLCRSRISTCSRASRFTFEDYWDQSLFEKFNRAYFQTYREMRTFLVENGIDTKMKDVAKPKDASLAGAVPLSSSAEPMLRVA